MGIKLAFDTLVNYIDTSFARSRVASWFHIVERQSKLSREIRAGTVTFLTASYILAINGAILGQTGGPCSASDCTGEFAGDDRCTYPGADDGYESCLVTVEHSLVTATALASLFATFLMGAGANLPIVCAPGMGLNAYFFSVVGFRGSGTVGVPADLAAMQISYGQALTAVFLEGIVFVILAVTGLRARLIRLVPRSVMLATATGIGLYLAFLGLQSTEGLGLVSFDGTSFVTLGGCTETHQRAVYVVEDEDEVCAINNRTGRAEARLPPSSLVHACVGGKISSGTLWLGLSGLLLTTIMMSRSFRASIITGIAFVTLVAWIPHHRASYLGGDSPLAGGEARLEYFRRVAVPPSVTPTGYKLDWSGLGQGQFWVALLTFLYVDFLDTTGTLFSMASYLNQYLPGFIDKNRAFPRSTMAFSVDGLGTMVASLLGSSPVATFIESAAGIREGGRTGLTALTACVWFFLAIFFTPILSSVPPYAVGGALITVGALMMLNVVRINWDKAGEAIPAFLTICIMPFTYSIAYGIIAGLCSYILVNSINWALDMATDAYAWHFLKGNEPAMPAQSEPSFWGHVRQNKDLAAGLGDKGAQLGKRLASVKSTAWIFQRRPSGASNGEGLGEAAGDDAASEVEDNPRAASFGMHLAERAQVAAQGGGARSAAGNNDLAPSLPLQGRGQGSPQRRPGTQDTQRPPGQAYPPPSGGLGPSNV